MATTIESFDNNQTAEDAIRELISVGFTKSQIGVISPRKMAGSNFGSSTKTIGVDEFATLPAFAGIAPRIGPAIAGGSLGVLFWSTTCIGAAGALSALGISDEHALRFETDFEAGCTIIAVHSGTRSDIAQSILNRFKRKLSNAVWAPFSARIFRTLPITSVYETLPSRTLFQS